MRRSPARPARTQPRSGCGRAYRAAGAFPMPASSPGRWTPGSAVSLPGVDGPVPARPRELLSRWGPPRGSRRGRGCYERPPVTGPETDRDDVGRRPVSTRGLSPRSSAVTLPPRRRPSPGPGIGCQPPPPRRVGGAHSAHFAELLTPPPRGSALSLGVAAPQTRGWPVSGLCTQLSRLGTRPTWCCGGSDVLVASA